MMSCGAPDYSVADIIIIGTYAQVKQDDVLWYMLVVETRQDTILLNL